MIANQSRSCMDHSSVEKDAAYEARLSVGDACRATAGATVAEVAIAAARTVTNSILIFPMIRLAQNVRAWIRGSLLVTDVVAYREGEPGIRIVFA